MTSWLYLYGTIRMYDDGLNYAISACMAIKIS